MCRVAASPSHGAYDVLLQSTFFWFPPCPCTQVPETGYVDEAGELRRPWCPATRILEHREQVRGDCAGWGG